MKVVILTMDGGHGTMSASLALGEYLRHRGSECSVVDFMKAANPLGNLLAELYNSLLRRDLRFASLYMEVAHRFPFNDLAVNILFQNRVHRLLDKEHADVVVLICPWIITPVLQALRQRAGARPRVYTVVVDLGRGMTPSWFNPGVDFTSLPTRQAHAFLAQFGIANYPVAVLGMPLTSEVRAPPVVPDYLHDAEGPICAVLGGREGGRNSMKIIDLLQKHSLDATLLIQCGRNTSLHQVAARRRGVKVIGFPPSIIPLLQASSIVITKPGALTISELVALRKPFILDTSPTVMPQERGNVDFVREENCGLIAQRLKDIPSMVEHLLSEPLEFTYPSIYGTDRIGELIIKQGGD